jgi:glucose/arabinose dehydrogenase
MSSGSRAPQLFAAALAVLIVVEVGLAVVGSPVRQAPSAPTAVAGSLSASIEPAPHPPEITSTVDGLGNISLVKVAEGLTDPVAIVSAPDDLQRLFVVERRGSVRVIDGGTLLPEPFIDIGADVATSDVEQGLLGMAFHPDYKINRRFFLSYTERMTAGDTFVAEYERDPTNPLRAGAADPIVRLRFDRPSVQHNGGTIAFGPDGYLYLSSGDGAFFGNVSDRVSQELTNPLGKILRVDVDVPASAAYGIPSSNPWADGKDVDRKSPIVDFAAATDPLPEIWAHGLRNPWAMSFDSETGNLMIPDVGDIEREEINAQPATDAGGANYGWHWLEGTRCWYSPRPPECNDDFIPPIHEYTHDDGNCAVSGVGTYRGVVSPTLSGMYVFGDFCSGRIWGLEQEGEGGEWVSQLLMDTALLISGGGTNQAGDLYLTSCRCDTTSREPKPSVLSAVWHLVAGSQE